MRQIASSKSERELWGRMIQGYAGAFGTGEKHIDPDASEIGLDGHIWMVVIQSEFDIRDLWIANGIDTVQPDSVWHKLGQYQKHFIMFNGYKFRKSVFSVPFWAASTKIMLDTDVIPVGWLSAPDIRLLFNAFDRWKKGQERQKLALSDIISSR